MKLYLLAALAATLFFTLPVSAQVGGTDQGVPDQAYTAPGTNVTQTVTTATPSLDGTVHVDGTVNHCGNVRVGGNVSHSGNVTVDGNVQHYGSVDTGGVVFHTGTVHMVYDQPRVINHTVKVPVYHTKTVEKVVEKSVPVYVPVPTAAPTPPAQPITQTFVFTNTPAEAPATPAPTAAEIAAAAAAKAEKDRQMIWLGIVALIGGIVIAIIALNNTSKVDLAKVKVDQDTLALGKTAIEKVAEVKDGDMTTSVSQGHVSASKTLQTVAAGTVPLHQAAPPAAPQVIVVNPAVAPVMDAATLAAITGAIQQANNTPQRVIVQNPPV